MVRKSLSSGPIRPSRDRRPRPQREDVDHFDNNRFSSQANAQWYMSKRLNTVVVEKTIAPGIDNSFHLHEAYGGLGWHRLLTLEGPYYPELVRQFYANLEHKDKKTKPTLVSWVKGVQITVTCELLQNMLGLPSIGESFHINKDFMTSDHRWKAIEAAQKFIVNWTILDPVRTKLLAKDFSVGDRVLAYSLSLNVIPRASGLNEV